MSRYIDADNLKERIPKDIHEDVFENCSNCELLDDEQVKELIDLQPTADVRENVKGKWLKKKGSLWTLATCSVCGELSVEGDKPFCSNCGSYNGGEECKTISNSRRRLMQ